MPHISKTKDFGRRPIVNAISKEDLQKEAIWAYARLSKKSRWNPTDHRTLANMTC